MQRDKVMPFMENGAPNLVIDYLKSLQEQGIGQLPVDDDARLILRKWMIAARQGTTGAPAPAKEVTPKPGPRAQEPYIPPADAKEADEEPGEEQETAGEITPEIHLHGNTLEEKLSALRTLAGHWEPARSLGTLRDTMVFAVGNPHSELMLIGEAPGYHEELQQEPFVGRAGEKLNGILTAMGVARESIYISNIVKFRPSMPRQTTNNRAPTEKEIAVSMPIISKEIELIRPKAIIALGATAARGLLGSGQAPLSSMRGRFHQFMDIPVRVTYHPSYLLRNEELSERRKVWEDMLAVMELLAMPVSDKQRNYFLPKR